MCIYDGPQRAALCLPGWPTAASAWSSTGRMNGWFPVRDRHLYCSMYGKVVVPPSLNYNILGVAFKFKQNNHKSLRALFSPECMFNCYSTSSLVEGNSKTRALLMTTC